MLSSHVCRQCKTRLHARRFPARISQWQPRATFLSLRSKTQQDDAKQSDIGTGPEAASTAPGNDQSPSYNLFDRNPADPQTPSNGQWRIGRYSKHLRNSANDAPRTWVINPTEEEIGGVEEEGQAYTTQIERHLRRSGLKAAWALFEKTYTSADCEALSQPSAVDFHQIKEKRFFARVLRQIITEFCEKPGEPAVTPTIALFKYEQLGIAGPELWVKYVLEPLTYQVILAANGASTKVQRDLPSLLSELVSIWRLFFQCKGRGQNKLEAIDPQWNLPAVDELPHVFESHDFNYRLQDLHPKCLGSSALGFCAIYMFNLSEAINANESFRLQAAPFLNVLARVLSGARVNAVLKHPAFSRTFLALPQEMQIEIKKEIDSAPRRALTALGQQTGSTVSNRGDVTSLSVDRATTDLESFNLKVIARAVESKTSPVVLEGHWKRVVRDYTHDGKTSIPPRIYNAFLSGYLVLGQAPRSVEVWNHMISNGVKPDASTWVAMLRGCESAKDLDGFNAMWERMQSSGVEPDNYLWTTRVHGLIGFRKISIGLRTLEEMGNRWRAAENVKNSPPSISRNSKAAKNLPSSVEPTNNCTKPSVEVINGAISAVVQIPGDRMKHRKRVDYVQQILKWGTQFDIKPDTVTFNILIQLYLNAADYATAFKVLKQMELNGVEADFATHVLLIKAAFDNGTLDDLPEHERATRLIQMFEELEANGLRLTPYVYTVTIDRLLKQYDSYDAVRTVIEHMRSRNLAPTAHVYTSLITYYFQQTPPAIAAVDSLLQQIFESPFQDTDKIMFDRTIEGYAEHGEVGKMMSVLTRMSKSGKHPGFQALTAVIKALVKAGDVHRARLVVRDVQRGEGIANGGVTGAINAQKHFLDVAQNLGIGLDEEGMTDVFKLRNDARVLDEQIKVHMQEERGAMERQPEPNVPEFTPEHSKPEFKDSESPEEGIHGFLASDVDADIRQR